MSARSSRPRSLWLAAVFAAWPALFAAADDLAAGGPGDPAPEGGGSDTLLDFDGEGHSDLLLRNARTGECLLWLMRGGRIQALVPLPDIEVERTVVGNGDYDGNGYADVLHHNASTGAVAMVLVAGSAPIGEGPVATIGPDSAVVGSGDYDGDGASEIAVHNRDTGVVELWDPSGTEIVETTAIPDTKGAGWRIVGSGDFDGDGDDDLLWQSADTGQLDAWLLSDFDLADEIVLRDRLRPHWRVVGTGHYNDDRLADVLIHDEAKGRLALLRNRITRGAPRLERVHFDTRPGPGRRVVHAGDFDSDGVLEIVLREARSGSVEMWFANGGKVKATSSLGPLDPDWFLAGIGLESPGTHRSSDTASTAFGL